MAAVPPPAGGPPAAPRRPFVRDLHGERVADDFAWMRDTDDPELTAYLEAENAWAAGAMAPLEPLRAELAAELAGVLPDDDESAPWTAGGWDYRELRPAGRQYTVLVRRRTGDPTAAEQVVLDENELAEGHDFLELGVREPSPDGRLLAYSVDHDGSEVYTLRVRDLGTGADLPDEVGGTYYGLGWSADSASVFYTTVDSAYRPDTVRRHVLGADPASDAVVWHEPDRRFELDIRPTRSGALIRLVSASRDTSEVRLVAPDRPDDEPTLVEPRVTGREYLVDHQPGADGGRLVVVTDLDAPEYRVAIAPVSAPGAAHWTPLLAHDPAVRVVAADAFGDHVVVTERTEGRLRLRVLDRSGVTLRLVEPAAGGELVQLARNDEVPAPGRVGSSTVRIIREGWVRPPTVLDLELVSGQESPVHTQALARDLQGYRCSVVHAVAEDGVAVPVSLVSRGEPGEGGPCLLYGYGAYESCLDTEFWPDMLPLLDRGLLLAVAHVRGGGELGRDWWQQGRLLRKRNTFTDFVAAARHLVRCGLTTPDRLAVRGISAGGLLMGVVTHLAPTDVAAVVAEVPFVDAVATMLDDTVPLTVAERDEWGDPRRPEDYAYLRAYSPCDNPPGPDRPALLVTASRHDPRVLVHEPAKWVARLRADEQARPSSRDAPLLLRTAMGAGAHTGPAGRYDAWAHEAYLHAFVLDRIGAAVAPSP